MKIIDSDVRGATAWRILLILAPSEFLSMSWQFGLTLARANNGELVTAVVIPNESAKNLEAAQTAVAHVRNTAQPGNSSKALIAADLHGTRDVESLVQTTGADLLLVRAESRLWQNGHGLDNVSCAVAVVRGDQMLAENGTGNASLSLPPAGPIRPMPCVCCCRWLLITISQLSLSPMLPTTTTRKPWAGHDCVKRSNLSVAASASRAK